jgi:hypothetical protein
MQRTYELYRRDGPEDVPGLRQRDTSDSPANNRSRAKQDDGPRAQQGIGERAYQAGRSRESRRTTLVSRRETRLYAAWLGVYKSQPLRDSVGLAVRGDLAR